MATGAVDRTVVGYKGTATNDPVTNKCFLTTLWRNNTCKPSEQALIGVEYIEFGVGCPSTSTCVDMVIADTSSWALAGSGLTNGSHITGLLGYEVDGQLQNNSPAGTQVIAKSPIPVLNSDAQSHPFSEMVTYTAASGATVVAVGTMQWSWGLDDWGAPAQRPSLLSPAVQKITQNVLARFAPPLVLPAGSGPPVSDSFNSGVLNTSLWTLVGNGNYSLNGSDLLLTAPGGTNHDPSSGGTDNAVRVLQSVNSTDFTVDVKFDSIPTAQYQFEGILVDQDSSNYLRFHFGSTGSSLVVSASKVLARTETGVLSSTISLAPGTAHLWLRVQKSGSTWTEFWSADGSTFTTVGSFVQALTLADIGPFVGNFNAIASAAPAFTAAIDYFTSTAAAPPGPPVSDDFNASTLNTNLWRFVNPVGNGSYSLNGSELVFTVPGGTNHDPAFGGSDNSVRVVQPVSNFDFTVEVKFNSIPAMPYEFEGLLIEQDAANYLRFQFGSTGSSLVVNASTILGHNETSALGGSTISLAPGTSSLWLRVQRSGSTWTEYWSTDGVTYSIAGSFSQPLTVADLGPYAGNFNATSAPAFMARIDYFHNVMATPLPDLAIAKSHTGSFSPGQTGAKYTLTVSNIGTAATSGTVIVSDPLPTGLTATAIAGAGWNCTSPGGPCTRNDALAAGASYPAITLTVNVSGNAPSTVINTATVSGGGESNTSNDAASDPTAIGSPVSDNFNSSTLNASLWKFVNPLGDGSFSLNGSELLLNVPAATNHDPALGGADNAVRVVQPVENVDFTVDVKFDSSPTQRYQFEGVLVEQDPANYLRFQIGSTGTSLRVGATMIVNHNETSLLNAMISPPVETTSLWLRIQKSGTTWTEFWSANGAAFNNVGSFTQSLSLVDIGPFVGNYNASGAPATTARIDYFFNTANPLAP